MKHIFWMFLVTVAAFGANAQIKLWQGGPHLCIDRAIRVKSLEANQQHHRGIGIHERINQVIELWVKDNPADPKWTILLTHANGDTCRLGGGTRWIVIPHAPHLHGGDEL